MSSLPLEYLTTFLSLLISSHLNIHRFYPHLLPPPLLPSHFPTCPPNTFLSNLLNASTLLLPLLLLFHLHKRGFHEKLHDFIIPFAFCIVWGMFIFEGKEELVKTDVVVFTIFPWLVFLGLVGSWICG
ncbi:hypothetical protein EAE96_007343 [Botrytis aclada]|nr:hypothetical protein EAE96_007343 [Botrytis aclada]